MGRSFHKTAGRVIMQFTVAGSPTWTLVRCDSSQFSTAVVFLHQTVANPSSALYRSVPLEPMVTPVAFLSQTRIRYRPPAIKLPSLCEALHEMVTTLLEGVNVFLDSALMTVGSTKQFSLLPPLVSPRSVSGQCSASLCSGRAPRWHGNHEDPRVWAGSQHADKTHHDTLRG